MRAKAILFAIAASFASLVSGQSTASQSQDRVFHFANTGTPQGFQEVANAIRSVGDVQQLSVDTAQKTLAVHGTTVQVALAEWLFNDLDTPANAPEPPHDPIPNEYRIPAGRDDVVRVFYLKHAGTPRGLQEIVNAIRSTIEVQRAVVCNGPRALALRGTVEQMAAAEWVINALDRPAGAPPQGPGKLEYRLSDVRNPVIRVFYLAHTPAPEGVQEIVNAVRSVAEVQRLVAYTVTTALVMRGPADQAAFAEWMIDVLDRPAGTQSSAQNGAINEYHLPGSGDVARVFYLNQTTTSQDSVELVNLIRSTAKIQRAVPCIVHGALTLRGTAVQIAQAERLIQEREKASAQ